MGSPNYEDLKNALEKLIFEVLDYNQILKDSGRINQPFYLRIVMSPVPAEKYEFLLSSQKT